MVDFCLVLGVSYDTMAALLAGQAHCMAETGLTRFRFRWYPATKS